MATIKDVAKLAGVSVATVSNLINGKTYVSDEKYHRIKEVMGELNYKPNYNARNLKKQGSKIIGVVLPSLDDLYKNIYEGISEIMAEKGYILMLRLTYNNIQLENDILDIMISMGVEGILIVPSEPQNPEKYNSILVNRIPIIFLERKMMNVDSTNILFDNRTLIFEQTKELLKSFSKYEIKLLVFDTKFSCEEDCIKGYSEVLDNNDEASIIRVELDKETSFNSMYELFMDMDVLPKVVITSSMDLAKTANEVFNLLDCKVEIYSLASDEWNVTSIYKHIHPITRRGIAAGKEAARILYGYTKYKSPVEYFTKYMHELEREAPIDLQNKEVVGKGKIRILAFRCAATCAIENLAYSFNKRFGIECEFDMRDYNELKEVLKEQVEKQKRDYDLVMIDIPWLSSVIKSDYLFNIKEFVEDEEILNKKLPVGVKRAFYNSSKNFFVIPVISTIQTIFYRKDIFENKDIQLNFFRIYGYDLAPPRTWTEFNTIVEFFSENKNPFSEFKYGTAMTALNPIGLIDEFLPRQWAFNGKIIDEWGSVVIDSDENVRALNNLMDTYKHSPPESDNYFWDDIFELLLNGSIPIAHGFASHYQPGYDHVTGHTYEKHISVMKVPKGKTMLGGWALGINKNSKKVDMCISFFKWILSDPIAMTNMRLRGSIPTLAVCQNDNMKSRYPWLRLIDDSFTTGMMREEIYGKSKMKIDSDLVDQILTKGINKAIHGVCSSYEALVEVKEEMIETINRS